MELRAAVAASAALITMALAGCVGPPADVSSAPARLSERADRAPLVVDDAMWAVRAQSAFEGMRDAAMGIESNVERARADILALHHDPDATPEDFRAALEAMRRRNAPLIETLLRSRAEAASATTPREWNELVRD